ncbi:hypothetical protein KBB96_05005 [Luteolibacter ambystomatis]|uniref:Uncharacterized protein n=1 Tax=Luteolibacter ambystomatis TaxID=2824561 RepID=A0A975J1E6_9BACT|nr:hypothetical protein [Luteolibacter ambystomatis]QUE52251.1 hypothetical protein KBB96_05005 [Luteolibacter ambystomatis]
MTPLDAFWLLRSSIKHDDQSGYVLDDRLLKGMVLVTPEVKAAFKVLSADVPELRTEGRIVSPSDLVLTKEATFVCRAPLDYFETVDELIRRHPISAPANVRVFDIRDDDTIVPLYRQIATLCSMLKEISAVVDRKKIILVSKESLEIPLLYKASDLREMPNLEEMASKLEKGEDLSSEAKRVRDVYVSLFTQAIYDIVSGVEREKRLPHLISHFDECLFKFRLSFRVFADEANKAIERYEDKRAGMIAALNGILGNIQTSLVGVPLAGVLALKEMKRSPEITYENVMIVVAVVVVGCLLLALSLSQEKALEAVKLQHGQLRGEIDKCGGGVTKAGALLSAMDSHQKLVWKLLWAVRILTIVFILVAIGALFCRVGPAENPPAQKEQQQ